MSESVQEPDRLPGRSIVFAALAVAVLSAVLVLLAWALDTLLEGRERATSPSGSRARAPTPGSTLFQRDAIGLREAADQRRRLREYGWVDRDAGVVHVPIDVAIELYLQQRDPSTRTHPPGGAR